VELCEPEPRVDPPHIIYYDEAVEDTAKKVDLLGWIPKKEIKFLDDVGSGGFGAVRRARWLRTLVAVKMVKPDVEDPKKEEEYLKLEARVMASLRHPNICEYLGYINDPFGIVLHIHHSDLAKAVRSGKLTREDRFRISCQTVSAVHYMHTLGLLHRDLKPANILLDELNNVKLADFGFTMMLPVGLVIDGDSCPGTITYMAPEVLLGKGFTFSSEVYSLGLILYFIFMGSQPLEMMDDPEIEALYRSGRAPDLTYTEKDFFNKAEGDEAQVRPHEDIFKIIQQCCSFNPAARPTIDELLRMTVDVSVLSAIRRVRSNPVMWKDHYSYGAYCDRVPLSEFITRSPVVKEEQIQEKVFELTLKRVFDFNLASTEVIEIKQFWYLSCWFPLFNRKLDSFKDMNSIVFADWFVRDDAEALSRLAVGEKNDFVLRPSTKYPLSYPFTVIYNKEDVKGLVACKARVKRGYVSDKNVGFKCDSLAKGLTFDSLHKLVEALTKNGFTVTPPPPPKPAYTFG